MAGFSREALNWQLLDIIRSMEEEGLVDHRLAKVHSMKENSGPFFFATTLSTFCHDSTETLRDLTQALGQIAINYQELEEFCIKMRGSASCIGGCRMANACREHWRAFQNRSSRERCVTALNTTKQEFLLLQEKMNSLVELRNNLFKKWVNKLLLQQVETWAAEYWRQHKDKLQ
ncbi:hypothetical protein COLO4_27209 [Corchorus olitorius]|uniref:Histidine-containing phosphotransfer protein n=1 Tax=Corchorus olitorius TaxID=93759 RepID=A0A1R3HS54_9ROSI|nr:hypothetical protein COLO4_27209 [Corchorus olitorius]